MAGIHYLLRLAGKLEEEDLETLWRWLENHCHHRKHKAVAGRFAGFYYTNAIGEIVMAKQQLIVGQAFTCPLIFTDTANNVVHPGPVGAVTSTDASVTAALSADGQSCNATMAAPNVTATLTWTGIGANGPFTFTVDVTDEVVAPGAVAGGFGQFVPGNTP